LFLKFQKANVFQKIEIINLFIKVFSKDIMAINYSKKMTDKNIIELLKLQQQYKGLENFYNISDKRLSIKICRIDENIVQFDIKFKRVPRISLLNKKITKYILLYVKKFAEETINISLSVKYPRYYPFKPPEWILCKYNDNILNEDISIYYKFIIQAHNEIYSIREQWSPAIFLRMDFLDLFLKITLGIKYTLEKDLL